MFKPNELIKRLSDDVGLALGHVFWISHVAALNVAFFLGETNVAIVQPVSVEEFRISVAETYDVLIEPASETAYTLYLRIVRLP